MSNFIFINYKSTKFNIREFFAEITITFVKRELSEQDQIFFRERILMGFLC